MKIIFAYYYNTTAVTGVVEDLEKTVIVAALLMDKKQLRNWWISEQ